MTSISVSALRGKLSEVLGRVRFAHERVLVSSHGKNVGAIVSIEDLNLLREIEDRGDILMGLRALETGTFTPLDEVEAELGL